MKKIFPKTLMRITRFSPSKPVVKASRKIAFEALESRQMLAADAVVYGPPIPESSPGETAFVAESPQPMNVPTLETFIASASSSQSVVISEETVPIDAEIENESSEQAEIRRVVFSSQDFSDSLNDDFTLVTIRPSVTNLSDSENLTGENSETNSGGGDNSGGGTSGGGNSGGGSSGGNGGETLEYNDINFTTPPEDTEETNNLEWSSLNFLTHYQFRSSPTSFTGSRTEGDRIDLAQVNLLDDYRGAMFDTTQWQNFVQHSVLDNLSDNLADGILAYTIPTTNVQRDFTNADDLFVYGDGYTEITTFVIASLISRETTVDSSGEEHTFSTYSVTLRFECEVWDVFADPSDTGFETGERYWLTGSWTESGVIVVTVEDN